MGGISAVDAALGLFLSNLCSFSSATLLLYDHAINFAGEVAYCWSKSWSFSSMLYLCIRYLGSVYAVTRILDHCISGGRSTAYLLVTFAFAIVIMLLCQAAITLRVWYLFSRSPVIRGFAITSFTLCWVSTAGLAGYLWKYIKGISLGLNSPTSSIAWIFAPSVLLHSILFALKIYRFLISPNYMQRNTLLWRFLKEGMFMYAFALASLLFVVIGLTRVSPSDFATYSVALGGSDLIVATTVVSVCRAMLSIRSLASTAHVEPAWLLNHAELSRVRWRHGTTDGEIVVDVHDDGMHLPVLSALPRVTESVGSSGE